MSSLQQGVGCALSLVVGLVFSPSLLSLHVSLTPKSSPPDRGQHYHRTLSVITTSGAHWKWSLSSGAQKEHTLQRVSQAASKVAMLIYFSISYVLKVFFFFFFTLSKEQTKENILFPGLGYCLWFIFHCFEKTCSSRFSYSWGHSLGSSVHTLGSSSSTFSKLPALERQW